MRHIPPGKKGYYKAFLDITKEIELSGKKEKILLHSCCAPCSSSVTETLKPYFDITIYYFNPNIHPKKEYEIRKEENERFAKEVFKVNFIEGEYNPEWWFDKVKGLENEPERGKRCYLCYKLRMEETAKKAVELNFDYFTTTLSVSPHKNATWINQIGLEIEKEYNIKFLISDFKKNGGYQRSLELSRKYNLYRQEYCGCIFSYRETTEKRKNAKQRTGNN